MIMFILSLLLMLSFFLTRRPGPRLRPPLPPGPKPLPYIGSLIAMLRNKPVFRWIHRMMYEMNTNILCVRLGNVHVIAVSDPKIALEFMKDKDEIFSSRPDCMSGYLITKGYLGTVLVPMSDHWKKMRKILTTEICSVARHRWLQNKRNDVADNLLRYIYNQCETNSAVTSQVVNLRKVVQHYSSNMIWKLLFGSTYFGEDGGPPGDEEIEHVDSLLTILSYLYAFCVTDYFPWLRWITDFDGHERIVRNAIHTTRKYQDPLIDERIQQWKDRIRTKEDDLLDVLINVDNPRLTTDQIKVQCLELMLAMIDSTSNIIEWAMAEMINHPKIFNKAVHELDSVVGKDRLVKESDIPKLNYIKACVREAFRLHPVAPFNLPHVTTADSTVGGYFIPKGSHVLVSRLGVGRNPEVWQDPLTYDPDRHMNQQQQQVVLTDNKLHVFSFGTGPRGCPGVLLGLTMTVMMLARLVQGFTWEVPSSETRVDLKENLNDIWKSKQLLAQAKPRLPHYLYPSVENRRGYSIRFFKINTKVLFVI